jgi:hypothetical protein
MLALLSLRCRSEIEGCSGVYLVGIFGDGVDAQGLIESLIGINANKRCCCDLCS